MMNVGGEEEEVRGLENERERVRAARGRIVLVEPTAARQDEGGVEVGHGVDSVGVCVGGEDGRSFMEWK